MRALALLLLLLLPQDKAELRVAWGTPATIDPAHAGATPAGARVAHALFTGLTAFGPDGTTPAAGAAERWSVSDDGLTWTFHLRDSRWSDGSPVTAQDFRFAWLRELLPETGSPLVFAFAPVRGAADYWEDRRIDQDLLNYESQSVSVQRAMELRFTERATARHAAALRSHGLGAAAAEAAKRPDVDEKRVGVEAVDARTLRVVLDAPRPTLPEELAGPAFLPVPEKLVREKRDQWTHPQHIATNGPYRVERWTRDELALVRASGEGPERVVLALGDHVGSMFEAYERGRVQWIEPALVPSEKAADLARRGDRRAHANFTSWHLRLNTARGPCAKPGVRRALARAVDRGGQLRSAEPGAEAAVGLVPPGVPGYLGASAPVQDLGAAVRALLAEAPDLTQFPRLNLLGPKGGVPQTVVFALKDQMEKNLGIRVRTDLREGPAYRKALDEGDYDLAYAAWTGPALDPASFLEQFAGWSGEIDGMVAAAAKERDAAKRLVLLSRAEQALVAEDGPVVPLHTGGSVFIARPGVRAALNPMGRVLIQHVQFTK